jgi:hypothetical protein
MTNFRLSGVRQTPWACGPGGDIWYACVHANIEDEAVIDTAKRLVDRAIPQKQSTFVGGHYYSFVTREYLLNLLLFHFQEHGLFPSGSVCIVNQWVWDGLLYKRQGKWLSGWAWRFVTKRSELKEPGYWVQIPSVSSVLTGPATTRGQGRGHARLGQWADRAVWPQGRTSMSTIEKESDE